MDYLQTTILNSGNTINFAAPVRVYSDLAETTLVGGYTTIQAAINDATTLNGYVVRVDAGTYNEKLSVNKSLYIRGTEATCILDGAGLGNGSGITITNATTGVSISGLTVRNHAGAGPNSFAGIYAVGGNNNLTVQNCTIRDNLGGSGFCANGPVDIVTLNNLEVFGHTN
ncbi:MAG: hypothetical protein IPG32_17150, partial [Saprospirales bacterium]|nr:hypothetical protein [Saprospirales bacterium]